MKKAYAKLTCLMISFFAIGCSNKGASSSNNVSSGSSLNNPSSEVSSSSSKSSSSNNSYTSSQINFDDVNILPKLTFTFDPNDPDADFATKATKTDLSRPEVQGTFKLENCPDEFKFEGKVGGLKVRGNQTAGWKKKGFRIKFDKKQGMMGLNNGSEFKKWVLLADAKDVCLIRTAMGFNISKAICKDEENIWVSDFTPVSLYLNDQYWGYYYLAEQKEVNSNGTGRVHLPETKKSNTGVDIGYCFELDYYASREREKGAEGDPTFNVTYSPKEISYNTESVIANNGNHVVRTYTMLSDIVDGPKDENGDPSEAWNENNSNQIAFIKKRLESLYTVLYEAAINHTAKTIENNEVVDSSDTVENVIKSNFDLDTFADGFILNAFDCAPDLGYSSFYMSFDNSETGDKKLRFDCPWDFDSNFGNRNNFIPKADEASSSGGFGGYGGQSYDPYWVDRTSNMWINLFAKLDFFNDIVKTKWNKLREEQAFENMFHMMNTYFTNYDLEIQKNHKRWPANDAANELRSPFKNTGDYKKAQQETISWCSKRVNYLEGKWGTGRDPVNTNA